MKKFACAAALIVLAAMNASCVLFEDVGSDPHPPSVAIIALVHYVEPEPAAPAPAADAATAAVRAYASTPDRSIAWDSGGFTLTPGQKFQIARAYKDAGGDIVKFTIRDRDGTLKLDLTPADQAYYTGTSGAVLGPVDGIEVTGVSGPHRLELWAEDSHESRSEKVEFVVTLAY